MEKIMANCGRKSWQDKANDAFTEWKDEYAHRVFCDMLEGDCDLHDTPEAIANHQERLKQKIKYYEVELATLKRMLTAHQAKWGATNWRKQ